MHQEFTDINELFRYAQQTPSHLGKGIYVVGSVSDLLADQIYACSGLQVAGYRVTIDHSAIIHALRQHGQPMEVLRGQLPISQADIINLAAWLAIPMAVADAGQSVGQPHCLRFEQSSPDGRTIAILEVRTRRNRQQLALKTCYKKRPVA